MRRRALPLFLLLGLSGSLAWGKPAKAVKKAAEGASEGGRPGVESLIEPDTQLIDVPTAGILDVGGFATQTRFFSEGGILEWLNFGMVHRLNLGASLNVERLVGSGTPVQLTRPELQLKFRFFDG
ncbi:MAG: hypothetical protein AAB576_06960, partial [Elusimicrobiota bacterium]